MQKNQLLKRIGMAAASLSLPVLASAGVGENSTIGSGGTESVTGTVRLTLSLSGTLRLRVYERAAGENPGNNNALAFANNAAAAPRDSVDFGTIDFSGSSSTNQGVSAAGDDGVAFIALLQADIYFAGASSADVTIQEGTTSGTESPGTSTRVSDFEFYWDCDAAETGFGISGTEWLASGSFDPTGRDGSASVLSTTPGACYSTTTAGETISRDVDLVIFLDENAPSGQYGADYQFVVNVTP